VLEVYQTPSITIGSVPNPPEICLGDSLVIEVTQGFINYSWNTGNPADQDEDRVVVFPTQDFTYVVEALDSNGCEARAEIFVEVDSCYGCMDSLACNYDSTATVDDGSCLTAYGCTDIAACNYDSTATCDDGSCLTAYGCMDVTACNYDSIATCDDGSCHFFTAQIEIVLDGAMLKVEIVGAANNPPYSFLWSNGGASFNITPTTSGQYWCIVTNGNGCDSTAFFNFILTSTETYISDKKLFKITDVLGRETKGAKNEPLFYIYDDGTVEKRIVIE
jgi:hypothetical protein